jgi:hypothetical protein
MVSSQDNDGDWIRMPTYARQAEEPLVEGLSTSKPLSEMGSCIIPHPAPVIGLQDSELDAEYSRYILRVLVLEFF